MRLRKWDDSPFGGYVEVLEVEDGKYGFIIQDREVVGYLRYNQVWNRDPIYTIPYNRATTALILEAYDLLIRTEDDLK